MSEETELMERYCDGDAQAFRQLYTATAPKLLAYLVRIGRDRALAEDLLQLTFLKIHRARSAYVRGANPVPWMYAIAHRTFLDEMRKKERSRVRLVREDVAAPEQAVGLDGTPAEASARPSPRSELTRAVLDALQRLPQKQREAVVLIKLDGKSAAEAAAITGSTPGAIKVRAHRGYRALRKALEEQELS